MRILVTAFDPFGGDDTNSSLMVLNALKDKIGDVDITKLEIPTVYGDCAVKAWEKAKEIKADAILSLGQAGGRTKVSVEAIGINFACADLADNNGVKKDGEKLFDVGENALFSTLPVKEMAKTAEGYVSVSAGGFVCNSLLYTLLKNAKEENENIKAGFVHLPYAKTQGKEGFSMSLEKMVECVELMIGVIESNSERNDNKCAE